MKEYEKIQTVYFRNPETKFKTLLEGQFAKPEFEWLKNNEWVWTEKIDGTNIRIMFDGTDVNYGGRTNNAHIPASLLKNLQKLFTVEKLSIFSGPVCLYGEGYGAKIQKGGGNYISDDSSFILFDIRVGDWWLERESLEEIAEKLDIKIVPILGTGTLLEAVEFTRNRIKSVISENKNFDAEGLVLKPKVTLFNRKGERIISKIKCKDF